MFRIAQNIMAMNLEADSLPNEDATETYLLTNKGLEKLDIEKEIGIKPTIAGNMDGKTNADKEEEKDNVGGLKQPFEQQSMNRFVKYLG